MEELTNSKINFELLKQVYNGLASFYIDTINYSSSNDVKSVLNNKYHNHKKFYRQIVFKISGSYFDNNKAKIIFNKIIKYCYLKKKENPGISIEECIRDWKNENLEKYIELSGKQSLDEDNRLLSRIKRYFSFRLSA